jgi:hypothetical protein
MPIGNLEPAIAPFITFICSLLLSAYVYRLNHEHLANKTFILFMGGMAIISFLDFSQALITLKYLALYFAKIKYALLPIIGVLFLHLSYALSDNKTILTLRKYIYIPYIVGILLFIITVSTKYMVSGVTLENNSYTTITGFLIPLLILCALLFLIIGFIILIITFKQTKNREKKIQLKYIFYGMSITVLLMLIFYQILPEVTDFEMHGSIIFTLPMFLFYTFAITKHKLMIVPKLVQEKDIPAEPIDYELEPGYTYIIPEKEPKLGFKLFAKSLKEGAHGICITMRDPRKIRTKFGLKKTPIIWITNKEVNEFTVKPEEISFINEILKPFFEKSEDSVIFLIDDKTITNGVNLEDHSQLLDLSRNFFDGIVTSNSRFIISVSPGSISPMKRKPIIKTKTPLLEFTRLSAFVFEDICNNILRFLIRNGYVKPEKISMHLANLSKKDDFFKKLKYRKSENPISGSRKIKFTNILVAQRLSKQILIDKIKLFMSEFENIETAMDLNSIVISYITKYGLSKNEFLLHLGDAYIILESDAHRSFDIFSEFLSKDFRGLCITKSNPKKIKRKYNLKEKGLKMLWLTDVGDSKKGVLSPKLEHILSAIEEFLATKQVKKNKKIILLDGIEYLITYSGDNFDSVLGFLRQATDRISETNGLILIPLNPNIVNGERIGLLTRSGMELYNT